MTVTIDNLSEQCCIAFGAYFETHAQNWMVFVSNPISLCFQLYFKRDQTNYNSLIRQ